LAGYVGLLETGPQNGVAADHFSEGALPERVGTIGALATVDTVPPFHVDVSAIRASAGKMLSREELRRPV
jgi:hypothetical protein